MIPLSEEKFHHHSILSQKGRFWLSRKAWALVYEFGFFALFFSIRFWPSGGTSFSTLVSLCKQGRHTLEQPGGPDWWRWLLHFKVQYEELFVSMSQKTSRNPNIPLFWRKIWEQDSHFQKRKERPKRSNASVKWSLRVEVFHTRIKDSLYSLRGQRIKNFHICSFSFSLLLSFEKWSLLAFLGQLSNEWQQNGGSLGSPDQNQLEASGCCSLDKVSSSTN